MKQNNIYNELLVIRFKNGNSEAFSELIRKWQKKIYYHAFNITHDEEVSWDIVQDTWITVIKSIKKLEDPIAFPCWIFKITNNKAVDWIRKETRKNEHNKMYSEINTPLLQSKDTYSLHDIQTAMRHLSSSHHSIISLFYIESFSVAEIAAILEIPEGTVKSKLYYGREKLKKILENL